MASINPLRKLGQLQNSFMFNIYIQPPAILGATPAEVKLLTFLGMTTSIPKYTRESEVLRYNNQEVVLIGGKTIEHSWSVKLHMTQGGAEYDLFTRWFYECDRQDIDVVQGQADVELLKNFAGDETERVTKKFRLTNIWPLDIPEIADLNQDEKTGLIDLEVEFAFDSMEPGVLGTDTKYKVAGY